MKTVLLSALLMSVVAVSVQAEDPKDTGSKKAAEENEHISAADVGYALGVLTGANLADVNISDIDYDAVMKGLRDFREGHPSKTRAEAVAVLTRVVQQNKAKISVENAAKEKEFLQSNSKKEGVHTTQSGLQYEVIREGSGKKPASADAKVKVHYHGTFIDGRVFDSSVQRNEPISIKLNEVIPGWTEGLLLMNVGGKYRFFIPSKLGYGDQGGGVIPPNSLLIFEVELLSIE
jgi:FKBP-type peptidyl-prolyl cis-trans isomerase